MLAETKEDGEALFGVLAAGVILEVWLPPAKVIMVGDDPPLPGDTLTIELPPDVMYIFPLGSKANAVGLGRGATMVEPFDPRPTIVPIIPPARLIPGLAVPVVFVAVAVGVEVEVVVGGGV